MRLSIGGVRTLLPGHLGGPIAIAWDSMATLDALSAVASELQTCALDSRVGSLTVCLRGGRVRHLEASALQAADQAAFLHAQQLDAHWPAGAHAEGGAAPDEAGGVHADDLGSAERGRGVHELQEELLELEGRAHRTSAFLEIAQQVTRGRVHSLTHRTATFDNPSQCPRAVSP